MSAGRVATGSTPSTCRRRRESSPRPPGARGQAREPRRLVEVWEHGPIGGAGSEHPARGEAAAEVLEDADSCSLFAQRFHPAMRHVGGPRREIGIRTLFNVLGPLSNPARPGWRTLVGVGRVR